MKMAGVLEQGWIYILWEGGSPEAGLNISDLEEQDILSFTLPFFHIFSILAANSVVAQNLSFLQMHIWSIWWIESSFVSSLYFILLCVHKIHISLSEMHTNANTSHLKNMIFFR